MNISNYEILLLATDTSPASLKKLRKTGNVQGTISEIVELARNELIQHLKNIAVPKTSFADGYLYTRRNEQDNLCAVSYFMIAKDALKIAHMVGIVTLSEAVVFANLMSKEYPITKIGSQHLIMPASNHRH